MPWVRVDDHADQHPKVAAVGPLGFALFVAGLCYCNRTLTDGFIPRSVARTLFEIPRVGKVINELEAAGLWEDVGGGYQVHNYLEFQASKEEVLAEREAVRKRVGKFRQNKRNGESNGDGNGVTPPVTPPVGNGDGNGDVTPSPTPKVLPSEERKRAKALSSENESGDPLDDQAVWRIYNEWRTLFDRSHGRYNKLLPERRLKIKARMREFTVDELLTVLRTAAADDWENRARYTDFKHLYRSRSTVEGWLERAEKPVSTSVNGYRTPEQKEADHREHVAKVEAMRREKGWIQ